jgi:hypothetical protein
MKTVDFVQSLTPSMERVRLTSVITDTRNKLKQHVIPLYKNAEEAFKGHPLASTAAKSFVAYMSVEVSARLQSNPFGFLAKALEDAIPKLDVLDHLVNKTFAGDVEKSAISYRGASILQATNAFLFMADYAATVLDRIVAAETLMTQKEPEKIDNHLVPAVKNYLDSEKKHFADVVKYSMIPESEFRDALENIPEVKVIPENHANVEASVGSDKLDPLKFNFFGLRTNPFYFFGKWWAERQVASYDATVQEAKQTELRLLELRQASSGKADAKLQQQINYNQERLDGLMRKKLKMEEDWAHA